MHYMLISAWIFAVLMLLLALLAFNPGPAMILLYSSVVPLLVILQAVVILRAKHTSTQTFADNWYEYE